MTEANVHVQDFAYEPRTDDGGMLLPSSNATMDSARRSLTSPSHQGVQLRWTEPGNASISSLHGKVSRTDLSDAGVSISPSEKGNHGPAPQPAAAIGEFKELVRACYNVGKDLESFTHQVQKQGSISVWYTLVRASQELRDSLLIVRELFEVDGQTLGLLLKKLKATKSRKQAKKLKKRRGTIFGWSHGASRISEYHTDNFIGALNDLARSVKKFTTAVMDFEDYTDAEGNKVLREFEIVLRVFAGGLEFFSVDGESPELQKFVTACAISLTSRLVILSEVVTRFETVWIPCFSFAQERSARVLQNAATVATFFAGVAATTLQYSVGLESSPREVAINTLWLVSLVLSIGAAITGLLATTWRQAAFPLSRKPSRLPWYIRFWIRSGYRALLIASVIAFLAGLIVYVFDTMPMLSFWIVTACTAFCVLGLAAVSALFLKEKYSFSQVRNDIRKEPNPVNWLRIYEHANEGWWYWLQFHLFERLREKRKMFTKQHSFDARSADPDKRSLATFIKDTIHSMHCLSWRGSSRLYVTRDSEAGLGDGIDESKRPRSGRKNAESVASAPFGTSLDRVHRHGMHHRHSSHSNEEGAMMNWYSSQVKELGLNLSAPVNTRAVHLQFSPHGHWLVVCYKYECCVFNAERSFDYHTTLRHHGKNAKQVEWSPSGSRLMTRTSDSVKVWSLDEEGNFEYNKTIHFNGVEEITDIHWLNDLEFLAVADCSGFFRVNVFENPPTKTRYDLKSENPLLDIYFLYTLPDSDLVMIVGARNIEELEEDKAIDCIIVYNMESAVESETRSQASHETWKAWRDYNEGSGSIKRRIPLLHELESLSFGQYVDPEAKHRRMVISYSDKPPEIWTVTFDNDRIHLSLEKELVRKLDLEEEQDDEAEWGEAFLIGPSQSIVACAEDGMMYFWDVDQSSHEQFHRLKIVAEDEEVEELPLISWIGPRAESTVPMMATAGRGLSLKIWAPMINPTTDDADQFHGPMDDGLVPHSTTALPTTDAYDPESPTEALVPRSML